MMCVYIHYKDCTYYRPEWASRCYTTLVCGFIGLVVAGIDCIVVQGSEAGGHRGTFYTTDTDYRSVAGYTLLQNG
jgi:hypothetical protein